MPYSTEVAVSFPLAPEAVYRELINLKRHPLWSSGMVRISRTGPMKVGLHYTATHMVLGREQTSAVEVIQLQENRAIKLRNDTGEIIFTILFRLIPKGKHQTEVICTLEFELIGLALTFARPVIESMAKTRLQGDLETLRAILET